jgi:phosphatidylglycerophosphate synthase
LLQIVGSCDQRLFGLTPAERLRRQWAGGGELVLVAAASAVLGDSALAWLKENPGVALETDGGRAVAVAVPASAAEQAARSIGEGVAGEQSVCASALGEVFVRKLRRRERLLARSLDEGRVAAVEKELFDSVYKGVTDLVTKYVWPLPAYWVTKLCARLHVHPNAVTLVGMVAMVAATLLWVEGELVAGMAFAWLMTFLDTVDGKLARVTVTSSQVGNLLDHVTDVIHPPIWWAALAYALASRPGEVGAEPIWRALGVILVGYVVGRLIEAWAKFRMGFNPFLWRPFDSTFRTIVSRRNLILLIMTIGLAAGAPEKAFIAAAGWALISVGIQLLRLVQAELARRRGTLSSWLA